MDSCYAILAFVLILGAAILALISTSNSNSEGMVYLNQYEHQDYYKDHPYIYPVPQTYTTGKYGFMRDGIVIDRAQRGCFS